MASQSPRIAALTVENVEAAHRRSLRCLAEIRLGSDVSASAAALERFGSDDDVDQVAAGEPEPSGPKSATFDSATMADLVARAWTSHHNQIRVSCAAQRASLRLHHQLCDRLEEVAASESGEVGRAPSNSSPSVIACQPCPNPSSENEGDAYVVATPFWYKNIIATSPRAGPSPASTSSTDTDVAESVGHKPIRVSCAARRASLRLHRQLCDRLEEVAIAQALGHVGCWSDDDSMEMSSIVIGDSPIGIMPAEYGPREPTTVEITEHLLRSNDPVIRSLYAEFKAVADSSDSDVEGSASNRLSESDSDAEGSASEAMTCSSHASDGAPDTPNAKRCRFDLEVTISV